MVSMIILLIITDPLIIIILVNMIFTSSVNIKFIKLVILMFTDLVILMFTSLFIISCAQARPVTAKAEFSRRILELKLIYFAQTKVKRSQIHACCVDIRSSCL